MMFLTAFVGKEERVFLSRVQSLFLIGVLSLKSALQIKPMRCE
jgi:hypothetical protein